MTADHAQEGQREVAARALHGYDYGRSRGLPGWDRLSAVQQMHYEARAEAVLVALRAEHDEAVAALGRVRAEVEQVGANIGPYKTAQRALMAVGCDHDDAGRILSELRHTVDAEYRAALHPAPSEQPVQGGDSPRYGC